MNERHLIEQLKKGEENAFKEVFRVYSGMVYNTTLSLLQNEEDARDMMQDVFIEILHSIKNFKSKSSLKTWIYRICITKSLDSLRARKREKRGGLLTLISFENDKSWMHTPDFNHPGVVLENKERAAVLFKAINKLPENQKVAFTLSKIEGNSYAEIASIMDTSVSSVESLLHRAKTKLRKLLEKFYEEDSR